MIIRPRCQSCGAPAEQRVDRVDDGPAEYYCRSCCDNTFVANLTPVQRPAAEVSAELAARHVTGTGTQ